MTSNVRGSTARTLPAAAAFAAAFFMLTAPASATPAHGRPAPKGDNGQGQDFAFGAPAKATDAGRTVDITMKDNFFEPHVISVKKGETVRFKVVNTGTFLHEFGLGTAAMHQVHQRQMRVMAEHGMIGPDRVNRDRMKMNMSDGGGQAMAHDDPNSILLEPGETGEIVWKFTTPMQLEFACNIPGHYEAGMVVDVKFE